MTPADVVTGVRTQNGGVARYTAPRPMPSPPAPTRAGPRSFNEARVRTLLGELVSMLRSRGRETVRHALVEALRDALALRPLRGGAFSSERDLFSELLSSWTEDATRLDRLLAAPAGDLHAHLTRAIRRLGRDVGVARRDPRARFQKSLDAALLGERRAAVPRLTGTRPCVRLLPAAGAGPHPWPDDVDDAAREGFLSRVKLVAAALAALSEAPDRGLSLRELRRAIGRRYALDARPTDDGPDGHALADPRSPATDAVHFDPTWRAQELLSRIPPDDARFWLACSEMFRATRGGAVPDARVLAVRVGCSEKTVQRWMARARGELAPLTQTTSIESMERYLHTIAALLRARA